MNFRCEFAPAHSILLIRLQGEITDAVLSEVDVEVRKRATLRRPAVSIVDCSEVTKFGMSSEFVRYLATREAPIPGLQFQRFIIAPSAVGFGLARMFQIAGEPQQSNTRITRSIEEVFAELGIEPPQFEPIE